MKYYSETLNKLYDTEQDLVKAEQKVKEEENKRLEKEKAMKAARATRAKEVEKALKDANDAQAKAIELLKNFTKDYGYFHMSYSPSEELEGNKINFFDLLNSFLQ